MANRLTPEQENIILTAKFMKQNETLKINALAGCGKTFTLTAIAKELKDKKFLYLAFNKAIVESSRKKFPKNVDIFTTHSLAYKKIVKKTDTFINDLKAPKLAELFNENDMELCFQTIKVFNDFLNSSDKQIDESRGVAFEFASDVYMAMKNRQMPITHSFYLKEFSLLDDKGIKDYDYILIDEAQDTNAVTLDIFFSLNGRKILVGDKHQAIYGFRGSFNAMEGIKAEHEEYLTKTFRCCEDIVKSANSVLRRFKNENNLMVSGVDESNRDKKGDSFAVITRTNAKIIENLAEYEDEYRLIKTPESIFSMALSMYYWLEKKPENIRATFSWLKSFKDKIALEDYIEKTNDRELQSSYKIAKRYKGYLYPLYKKAEKYYKNKGGIYLLTAHTSKGLEFDRVELENDFPLLTGLDFSLSSSIEEVNLYYVAITRAKWELENGSKNENVSQ